MRIASTFNIAFRALRRNKLRSVLTALGIIIGVAAVIAMVGIGKGAKAQVEAQIASLGQNVILVFSGSTTSSGIRTGWGGAGTLKMEDAEAIRREVPGYRRQRRRVSTSQVAAGIKIGLREFTASRPITLISGNGRWPTALPLPPRTCGARTRSVSSDAQPPRKFTGTKTLLAKLSVSKMSHLLLPGS
jgi:hypothetical protein